MVSVHSVFIIARQVKAGVNLLLLGKIKHMLWGVHIVLLFEGLRTFVKPHLIMSHMTALPISKARVSILYIFQSK